MSTSETTINLTQALATLKTLDKRIQKAISSGCFLSLQGTLQKPTAESKKAQPTFQSINDLINYRRRLKAAIIASNSQTLVTIAGEKMTVAEAIEMKSSIKHRKHLLEVLVLQYNQHKVTMERKNTSVRQDIESKLSRSGRDEKAPATNQTGSDLAEWSKNYYDLNCVRLYDPLKVTERIQELENSVSSFENEVDYTLSTSNATTMITV